MVQFSKVTCSGKLSERLSSLAVSESRIRKCIYAYCDQNELQFLVDTGGATSLLPKSLFEPEEEHVMKLLAVNDSTFNAYGTRDLFLDLSLGVIFKQTFLVADIFEPILGIDSLANNNIIIDVSKGTLHLSSTLKLFCQSEKS